MRRSAGLWTDHRPPRLCRGPGSCWPWPPRPSAPTRPAAGAASGPPRAVRSARVTILSTMLADTEGLGEWGFAAPVEADGHRLLFHPAAFAPVSAVIGRGGPLASLSSRESPFRVSSFDPG